MILNSKIQVVIEPLHENIWRKICKLSVSDEQKRIFSVPNVYWIGISRYEEHSELFAIKYGNDYVGLIGGGLDEDGISGYINPLMVDARFQRQGIAAEALHLMMNVLIRKYHVPCIHIGHRKENHAAGCMKGLDFPFVPKQKRSFSEAILWIIKFRYYLCVTTPNERMNAGNFS